MRTDIYDIISEAQVGEGVAYQVRKYRALN